MRRIRELIITPIESKDPIPTWADCKVSLDLHVQKVVEWAVGQSGDVGHVETYMGEIHYTTPSPDTGSRPSRNWTTAIYISKP